MAQGYNGFPAGCKDDNLDDRMSKYEKTIHAEDNLIFNACNSGISLNLSTVAIFGMYPCPECVKHLAQVKVARIIFQLGESQNLENWQNKFDLSRVLMHDLGIGFTHYRNENSQVARVETYLERKLSEIEKIDP
jgi:deoxycytidylate deaminase